MLHALLIIWSLNSAGSGTVTLIPQFDSPSCELAGAHRADTSTTAQCVGMTVADAVNVGRQLDLAHCTVTMQARYRQIWTCSGRAQ